MDERLCILAAMKRIKRGIVNGELLIHKDRVLVILLLILMFAFNLCCTSNNNSVSKQNFSNTISMIEFNLSAFGVESDNFPSIVGYVDFIHDSSIFTKSFYNPAIKGSTYSLSHKELERVLELLQKCDLKKLKSEYKVGRTDQATSTITIYLSKEKIIIKDYGLEGEYPLKEIYKIAYKF